MHRSPVTCGNFIWVAPFRWQQIDEPRIQVAGRPPKTGGARIRYQWHVLWDEKPVDTVPALGSRDDAMDRADDVLLVQDAVNGPPTHRSTTSATHVVLGHRRLNGVQRRSQAGRTPYAN